MVKLENKLRETIRRLPCFSCIVRPFCFEINEWGVNVENACEEYNKWHKKYQKIYNESADKKSIPYVIVISELKKIQQKERKRNAENCENRQVYNNV